MWAATLRGYCTGTSRVPAALVACWNWGCSGILCQGQLPSLRVLPLPQVTSDRVGEQLVAIKSREVDAILGSHASDEVGASRRGRQRGAGGTQAPGPKRVLISGCCARPPLQHALQPDGEHCLAAVKSRP